MTSGLTGELLRGVLDKVTGFEPTSVAVLLRGSYATGTADADSDLDLTAVTEGEPRTRYRSWFERGDARLLPISVSAKSVEEWLAKRGEAAEWALGFPAVDVAAYLWAADGVRETLGEPPSASRPEEDPCIEDFVAYVVKTRRAARWGDSVGLRLASRGAAFLAPPLLRDLNPRRAVRDHREAVLAALALAVAPKHYAEDFRVAAGLVPAADAEILAATERLARELLAFLRGRMPGVDPQPDVTRYLSDGTWEAYLG
ncbi:MAG TPA: nucleotidyltransferase domain-containing protein [Gaiellaceae bacterium]|nr:nucleotidyltransferase domain-containing protein [Gaiellaceae bacterium]